MTDTRTVEQIAASVDEKLAALPVEAQTAAAVFAQGLMAGMAIQKSA